MVKLTTLSFLVGTAAMQTSQAFVTVPQRAALSTRSLPANNFINAAATDGDNDTAVGVEAVSLAGLGDDHEAVGATMAESVAAWLDAEWMSQEVHVRMGTSVQNTYVACRSKGIEEVAEIMTQVTDDLFERWSEYDADAFVNAWDIGNYVADYLIEKSGSETCGCSTKIVE
mmetsp:Transcript_11415/g.21079  ORF Transcript_11415/g.21079 Transcript_11415/m.21079 type:complete len:171 (+) Transcript_11415:105-617(+)